MIRIVDVETTGLEPTSEVVEVGFTDLSQIDGAWVVGSTTAFLVDPGVRIEPEASAIHHIVDDDVKGAPLLTHVWRDNFAGRDDIEALAAHHARFESQFLVTDLQWICTWKCSVHLAPNLKSHKNQSLRYSLKLDVDPERASPPHRAGPDSYVSAVLLARILKKLTVSEALTISANPILLPRMPIGDHRDKPFEEVDSGFLEWCLRKIKDNEDLLYTCRHHLELRSGQRQRIVPGGHGEELPIDGSGT